MNWMMALLGWMQINLALAGAAFLLLTLWAGWLNLKRKHTIRQAPEPCGLPDPTGWRIPPDMQHRANRWEHVELEAQTNDPAAAIRLLQAHVERVR